jgi:hypothetical protein
VLLHLGLIPALDFPAENARFGLWIRGQRLPPLVKMESRAAGSDQVRLSRAPSPRIPVLVLRGGPIQELADAGVMTVSESTYIRPHAPTMTLSIRRFFFALPQETLPPSKHAVKQLEENMQSRCV